MAPNTRKDFLDGFILRTLIERKKKLSLYIERRRKKKIEIVNQDLDGSPYLYLYPRRYLSI